MHSGISSSLTRFDVVMAFLRAQLWISIVGTVASGISVYFYSLTGMTGFGILNVLRIVSLPLVLVLLLLLFPALLASNSLGQMARDPVTSLTDLRPLVGRCAGLFLFVQSIPQVVLLSIWLIYTWVSSGSVYPSLSGSAAAGRFVWIQIAQSIAPIFFLGLGFVLAFGPVIRDNFRVR